MIRPRKSLRRQRSQAPRARLRLEALEERTVLSAPGTSPSFEAATIPGEWIAQFRNVTGTPQEQIAAIRQSVESLGVGLQVRDHLGADGLVLIAAPAEFGGDDLRGQFQALGNVEYVQPN